MEDELAQPRREAKKISPAIRRLGDMARWYAPGWLGCKEDWGIGRGASENSVCQGRILGFAACIRYIDSKSLICETGLVKIHKGQVRAERLVIVSDT
jgi:hypothetical protein